MIQMIAGAVVGLVGGRALLWFVRRVSLPCEGPYPIRTLACAAVLFGAATLAHGSGFLAVFVAGIVLGDERAPYKREIERFHSALAALAEIVAFVVLGLTVNLDELTHENVWLPGLILAVVVAFGIRPLFVGACLAPAQLRRNENAFILFAGLKGAVPLLIGELMLAAGVNGGLAGSRSTARPRAPRSRPLSRRPQSQLDHLPDVLPNLDPRQTSRRRVLGGIWRYPV